MARLCTVLFALVASAVLLATCSAPADAHDVSNSPGQRSLSGIPYMSPPSPPAPPATTPPPLSSSPWLPQCTVTNASTGYTLLALAPSSAAPASPSPSPSSSSDIVHPKMTCAEWVRQTGVVASAVEPMPLPIVGNVSDASLCPPNVAYPAGPTASRTTCLLVSCFTSGSCYTCSGTFVADPEGHGRLLYMTASHCVAKSLTNTIVLANSYVTCNRNAGTGASGDGIFQPTAVTISKIDFEAGYGITDGALIKVRGLSNTNLAYAKPVSVGAVTAAGLAQAVPNFSAGFPQVDSRLSGCTADNLGNVNAIHYSRVTKERTLTNIGIEVHDLSGCGGNSGGTMVDERACILWGVLSATTISCSGAVTSSNYYSRIVANDTDNGVPFLHLGRDLVDGQVVFVN